MPRKPRIVHAGEAVHVTRRGHNRAECFFSPEDRALYVSLLVRFAQESGCGVHAYVLMPNHVHLLATPREPDGVSRLMHGLSLTYTKSINRSYRRTGTLWEERMFATPVTTDAYVLACYRYIEMNPVRAGIVADPREFRWSSHASNTGTECAGWLVRHPSYLALGRTIDDAVGQYVRLFTQPLDDGLVADLRTRRSQPSGTTYVPRTRG